MSATPPKPGSKSRVHRAWRAGLWSVTAILLALVLALWFLLETGAGLRVIRAGIDHFGGKTLHIGAVEGSALGGFTLHDVRYDGRDGTRIRMTRLHLEWVPGDLLHDRLHLRDVEIDALHLALPPTPSQTSAPAMPRLPARSPLGVQIDRLKLRDVQVHRGEQPPLDLASVDFAGSWIGDRLRIDRLDTTLPQTGPVHLQAQATTTPQALKITALRLKGPGDIDAHGTLGYAGRANDLTLAWNALRWPLTGTDAGVIVKTLQGQAQLTGTLQDYRFDLSAQAQVEGRPLRMQARGRGGEQQAEFDALTLDAGKAGSVQAQGNVRWTPQPAADLALDLHGLDPKLFVKGWNGALNGHMQTQLTRVDGQPRLAFTATLAKSRLRGYPLQLTAQGEVTPTQLHLQSLQMAAAKGKLRAHGTLSWKPQLSANLQLVLDRLNPQVFAPQWPGVVNGHVHLRTPESRPKQATVIAFDANIDHSRLRGQPLNLKSQGQIRVAGNRYRVDVGQLQATLGATRLSASGRATPPFDLKGKFDSTDLRIIAPQLGGKLSFTFTLQGSLQNPHLITQGEGQGLRDGLRSVREVRWHANLDPLRPSQLQMTLHDAQLNASESIALATLQADGTEKYQHIHLHAVAPRGTVDLVLAGGYDRKRREWGGQIASARLAPVKLPAWTLQNSPGLLLGLKRFSLEPTCLASAAGRACLNLQKQVKQPGMQVAWTLDALQLSAFKPLLPARIELEGHVSGSGHLRWVNGDFADTQAQLTLSAGRFAMPGAPPVTFQPSHLSLTEQGRDLHAKLDLETAQGRITADASAAAAPAFGQRALSGRLQIALPDLAFLQPFVSGVQSLQGHVDGALDLGGTLEQPRFKGRVELANGGAKLTAAGITLVGVDIVVSGQGNGPLAVKGTATSGGGKVLLDGTVDPTHVPMTVAMVVKGENFQIMDTPDARVWVNPNLALARNSEGIDVTGSLLVPKAQITPRGGLGDNGGVGPSADQIIVGAKPAPKPQVLRIHATMALVLGDQVSFKGYGLTTNIRGGVLLTEKPGRPTLARGGLYLVHGRYKAYGQDLTIKTGRLIFDGGPVTEPGIDILAVRKPREDIQVGVQVRGTLDQPRLTLTSTPAMTQQQTLSWLLFSHPLTQGSSADQNAVAAAALSLGLSGGDALANQIGNKLGIGSVSIGTASGGGSAVAANPAAISGSLASQGFGGATAYGSQAAQLTLGKYLTPRLFVSYGVSLFQPGQVLRLLYSLGHGFKLQTESGTSNGGDLIYTFEGGK